MADARHQPASRRTLHEAAPPWLASLVFHAALDEQKTHLMPEYFELRPQVFFELYVQLDLWRSYLERNKANPRE